MNKRTFVKVIKENYQRSANPGYTNNYLFAMVKGSALFIVIVMALVIGLLTSVVVLIGFHHRMYVSDIALLHKLESNLKSGINIVLAGDSSVPYDEEIFLDLYGESEDTVSIRKVHWGLWDVAYVSSISRSKKLSKSFILGRQLGEEFNAVIYLSDFGRPLSVSGNTVIKGNCYLPEAGIKRAYIEGRSFSGSEMVHGKILKSKSGLPLPSKEITKYLIQFLEDREVITTVGKLEEGMEGDTVDQLFSDSTLVFDVSEESVISNKVLKGNIMLWSDTVLTIGSSSYLEDIIVFASGIVLEDGFKGRLQLFAKDSIIVGNDCILNYPSALGIFKIDFQTMQPFIRVKKSSEITGEIFALQMVSDLQQCNIHIANDSKVTGRVHSEGFLEVQGEIHGNAACNKFILKTPSTTYENHLLDAKLDRTMLSPYFVGSNLFDSTGIRKVIKYIR